MFRPNQTIFAGVDSGTLQGWLTDAQAAYVALSSGGQPVTVNIGTGQGHRMVTYTKAELGALTALIKSLQAQLGLIRTPRRGLPVVFT